MARGAVGIVVMQGEICVETLLAARVAAPGIRTAPALLLYPARLVDTLRL